MPSNIKVLLVDDNPMVLEMLRQALAQFCSVTTLDDGADALLNYRVGLDYAHSAVYFQQVSKLNLPDMDVVGLVLRPESDGSYSVLGVADYEGKPSVPEVQKGDVLLTVQGGRATGATMGQVWSLLSGSPGDTRTLVLERAGKQFTVSVPVRRFLNSSAAEQPSRKKAGKKK